jgi:hypothetical protein
MTRPRRTHPEQYGLELLMDPEETARQSGPFDFGACSDVSK